MKEYNLKIYMKRVEGMWMILMKLVTWMMSGIK